MTTPININNLIRQDLPEIQQLPVTFPDNLEALFEESPYNSDPTMPFRELPLGDYRIDSTKTFKTKDKRDCTILSLTSRQQQQFNVFAPDRLREQMLKYPDNAFTYLRNLGLKTSQSTQNQYFDYRLA